MSASDESKASEANDFLDIYYEIYEDLYNRGICRGVGLYSDMHIDNEGASPVKSLAVAAVRSQFNLIANEAQGGLFQKSDLTEDGQKWLILEGLPRLLKAMTVLADSPDLTSNDQAENLNSYIDKLANANTLPMNLFSACWPAYREIFSTPRGDVMGDKKNRVLNNIDTLNKKEDLQKFWAPDPDSDSYIPLEERPSIRQVLIDLHNLASTGGHRFQAKMLLARNALKDCLLNDKIFGVKLSEDQKDELRKLIPAESEVEAEVETMTPFGRPVKVRSAATSAKGSGAAGAEGSGAAGAEGSGAAGAEGSGAAGAEESGAAAGSAPSDNAAALFAAPAGQPAVSSPWGPVYLGSDKSEEPRGPAAKK